MRIYSLIGRVKECLPYKISGIKMTGEIMDFQRVSAVIDEVYPIISVFESLAVDEVYTIKSVDFYRELQIVRGLPYGFSAFGGMYVANEVYTTKLVFFT